VAQNVPPDNRLMPAPETFRMSGWSIASSYTDYEKQGPMSIFHDNKHKGPDTGVVRKDGPADVLTISDVNGGATIATLQMPPHQSFGVPASMMDPSGNVIATLVSAETRRPQGMDRSSFHIFAGKPQYAGHMPDAQGRYLWATVTRQPWTFAADVTNSANQPAFKLSYASRMGMTHASHKAKIMTAAGEGVMLCGPTKNDKPKQHDIVTAAGGDSMLYCLILVARNLCEDELEVLQGRK